MVKNMMQKIRRVTKTLFIVLIGSVIWAETSPQTNISASAFIRLRRPLGLDGEASGGGLRLFRLGPGHYEYIGVPTTAAEPSRAVIDRFNTLSIMNPKWSSGVACSHEADQRDQLYVDYIIEYCVSGEEDGLGIPKAPVSFTCNYDRERNWYVVAWDDLNEVPTSPCAHYGEPSILHTKQGAEYIRELGTIPKNMDPDERDRIEETLWGKYGDTPRQTLRSPFIVLPEETFQNMRYIALVLWSLHSISEPVPFQSELYSCPSAPGILVYGPGWQASYLDFPLGKQVIPNWVAWGGEGVERSVVSRAGVEDNQYPCAGRGEVDVEKFPQAFYQRIRIAQGDQGGGIWRDYLGLTAGHVYRVRVRLNTLEMPAQAPGTAAEKAAWTFSVHASPRMASEGSEATYAQWMGLDPWFGGAQGAELGQIACYGPETTTSGAWVERVTGDGGSGSTIGDITLPEGCDRITVWLRCTGSIPGGVGMDWIRFEDRTVMESLATAKTPHSSSTGWTNE